MAGAPRQLKHEDYSVGWICALPRIELVAAGAMLDEEHPILPAADAADTNSYLLGRIGAHNVVIACLPAQSTGKVSAATVAMHMVRSFKAVRFGLMVGIGGGAPYYDGLPSGGDSDEDSDEYDWEDIQDIRLGDVVISQHSKSAEAVVQYDFGRSIQGKEFVQTGGKLNKPPNIVLNAISMLQGQHERKGNRIPQLLSDIARENPRITGKFQYPRLARDQLFKSDVVHIEGRKSCKGCSGDLDRNIVRRKQRSDTAPMIHYGTIGSADQVMRDAVLRDKFAKKENIKCFEMEAAGLMDSFPCLVIRGICAYADSHRNWVWQPYAAATAAAYAKELLYVIPGQAILDLSPIDQIANELSSPNGKLIGPNERWHHSEQEEEEFVQALRISEYERQKELNLGRQSKTCLWLMEDERFPEFA